MCFSTAWPAERRSIRHHRATQQVFLEAHEHAFDFFGGVFSVLRYDNLKVAVSKILRGFRPEETARFIAFRSHWRFVSEFCTPYEAHEKGRIEARPLLPAQSLGTDMTDYDALLGREVAP